MVTVEGSRLEGVILRSQLLVLLQRRHFCDQHGRPVGREYSEKQEIELEVRPAAGAGRCLVGCTRRHANHKTPQP